MWTTMSSSRRISESATGSTGSAGELMPLPDPLAQRTRSRNDTENDAGALGERSIADHVVCCPPYEPLTLGGERHPAVSRARPARRPAAHPSRGFATLRTRD